MEQSNFNFEGLSEEDIRMAKESAFNGYFNSQNQMDCSFGLNFDMDKNTQGDVELKEKVVEDEKIMNLHNEAVHYMEKAFECLKEAAEQNHVESLYKLGLCYYTGFGVKEDRKKAMSIYSQAAEKGYVLAQYALAQCYALAQGTECNMKKAFEWYLVAAKNGHGKARVEIAKCYHHGIGTEENKEYAFEWMEKAGDENGEVEALYYLGQCYENSTVVEPDYDKAVEYYTKAAEKGSAHAQLSLGYIYLTGRLNVDEDHEKAAELFTAAAEQQNAEAYYYLGRCYGEEIGVERDPQKAVEYFKKAIENGCKFKDIEQQLSYYKYQVVDPDIFDDESDIDLSADKDVLFTKGIEAFTKRSYTTAVKYLTVALEKGHEMANVYLGNAYYNIAAQYDCGRGVKQDYQKSMEFYIKSAELGFQLAQLTLGQRYEVGLYGFKQDYEQAVKWYKMVASSFPIIKERLALLYYKGLGVEQNYSEAVRLLKECVDANSSEEVLNTLGDCYANGLGVEQDLQKAQMYYDKVKELWEKEENNKQGMEDEDDEEDEEVDDVDLEDDDENVWDDEEEKDPFEQFAEKLQSCEVDEEKVLEVENAYGIKAPEMLRRMVTMCTNDDDNYVANVMVNIFRFMTISELLNPIEKLGVDCKSMGYVPVADCLNEDMIVYSYKKKKWLWRDKNNDTIYMEEDNLWDILWSMENEFGR